MSGRVVLVLFLALGITQGITAQTAKVRVTLGIDPRHPYAKEYDTEEKRAELQAKVLQTILTPLQEKIGFARFVADEPAESELRITIADKRLKSGDGERPVHFKIEVRNKGEESRGEPATYLIFREQTDWLKDFTPVKKFSDDISLVLRSHFAQKSSMDRVIREQLSKIPLTRGADCLCSRGMFVLRVRDSDLMVQKGTLFEVRASIYVNEERTAKTTYKTVIYEGADAARDRLTLAVAPTEPGRRDLQKTNPRHVTTDSVHIYEYVRGNFQKNAPSASQARPRKQGP
jgi:hypothetical protein